MLHVPSSDAAETKAALTVPARPDARPVTDFTDRTPDLGWYVVNDGVMGGRSQGDFVRRGPGIGRHRAVAARHGDEQDRPGQGACGDEQGRTGRR